MVVLVAALVVTSLGKPVLVLGTISSGMSVCMSAVGTTGESDVNTSSALLVATVMGGAMVDTSLALIWLTVNKV